MSVRRHRGVPMPFMSVRNLCTYFVVSALHAMSYGLIHRDALSTNMIRYTDPP